MDGKTKHNWNGSNLGKMCKFLERGPKPVSKIGLDLFQERALQGPIKIILGRFWQSKAILKFSCQKLF
jgi:hypothetical protein